MICPKCNNEQDSPVECQVCGIIFQKYYERQEKLKEQEKARSETPPSSSPMKMAVTFFVAGVLVTGAVSYYFLSPKDKEKTARVAVQEPSGSTTVNKAAASGKSRKSRKNSDYNEPYKNLDFSLAAQIEKKNPANSPVEHARNATVSVETSWGKGSGFFIDDRCHIITNKHVIKLDDSRLKNLKEQAAQLRSYIKIEKDNIKKLEMAKRLEMDFNRRKAIEKEIKKHKKNLAELQKQYDQVQSIIRNIEGSFAYSDIKVILSDKSEHTVISYNMSPTYDLALMSISCNDSPYLTTASTKNLTQGERVYAIGNPVGLSDTVTSGIFSGYREIEEKGYGDFKYLQTDAPINPGNSGGPLINKNGDVLGVNTLGIMYTDGLGFAIPIEIVMKEFSHSMH